MRVVIVISCFLAAVSANFYDYGSYAQPPAQYYPQPQQQQQPQQEFYGSEEQQEQPQQPQQQQQYPQQQPQQYGPPQYGPPRKFNGYNNYQNTFDKPAQQQPYYPQYEDPQGYAPPQMRHSQRSAPHVHAPSHHHGHHGYKPVSKPSTRYVPVVVKKKTKKNRTVLTTHRGFYIPNGTQMFGKFADLKSCQKACELTPTCFAADYNPWVKKCYSHGNVTACAAMQTHKQITHFKKIVCTVTNTPRGLVTLGAQVFKGIKVHDIKDLASCIKKCTTLGGGIAPSNTAASVGSTPQICFGIDFDFSSHTCYLHIRTTTSFESLCATADPVTTSKQTVANPTSVNILICPLSKT